MKRSPELEALLSADESAIRDSNAGRSRLMRAAALFLGGVAVVYFIFMSDSGPKDGSLTGDEEFHTTQFSPSSFERKAPEPPQLVELPPPPPPPEVKELPPPPPPPVEEFPNRFLSGMLVFDEGPEAGEGRSEPASGAAGADRHSQFLAAASTLGDRKAIAEKLERIDALVPEGTMIPGILETAINSDLPGQVRAIVTRDVYSFDGRRVLIPTGARLIGEYEANVERGQKRIFVVWTRLIRNDGVSVRLNSIGADAIGRAGVTGHVDTKFMERFSTAILLTVVGAGASYAVGPDSAATLDIDTGAGTAKLNNGDRKTASEIFADTTSELVRKEFEANLDLPPTISIPQGERIFVYVRQDLDFSDLYDDPVTEAMKEIKRERGLK